MIYIQLIVNVGLLRLVLVF